MWPSISLQPIWGFNFGFAGLFKKFFNPFDDTLFLSSCRRFNLIGIRVSCKVSQLSQKSPSYVWLMDM